MSLERLLDARTLGAALLSVAPAAGQGSIQVQIPAGTNLLLEQEFAIFDDVGFMHFPPMSGPAPFCSFSMTSGVLIDPDGIVIQDPSPAGIPVLGSQARLVMPGMPPSVIVVDMSNAADLKLAGTIPLPCGLAMGGTGVSMAPDGHTGFLPTLYSCVHSFDIDTMSLLDPDGVTLPGKARYSGLGNGFLAVIETAGSHVYGVDVSDPTDLKHAWTLDLPGVGFSEVELSADGRSAFVQVQGGAVYSFDLSSGQLLDPDGLQISGSTSSWLDRHGDVLACAAGANVYFIDIANPASLQLISVSPVLAVVQASVWGASAFSSDGSRFAAASVMGSNLQAVDVATGSLLGSPLSVGSYPSFVTTFGPDDRVAVLCGQDDTIRLVYGLLAPVLPQAWCSPKANSQGCHPLIDSQGLPSASSPAPFLVTASKVINQNPGLLFYGTAPLRMPFQGGLLCVAPPQVRTSPQTSGGNPPPSDCSGAFVFDFNAWIRSGVDPQLVPGVMVYAQHWYRDPASLGTTGLTNSLQFVIGP